MKAAKKIDMTQGSIMKRVLLFALPICVGNVLQQLYGTVDTLVIGNFCGSVSLAAVGTSSQPVEILLCVFLGLGTGVSILVSQFTGRGDMESLKEIGATAISFLFLCSIPLTIIGQFAGPAVLRFMQVPDDTWELANAYISIIFFGTLGNMGYNMNAGILRGMGDSNASLLFLIVSCVVNIVLDLLFVAGMGMDVPGAALATTIAMYCSWLFSIVYIRKKYPEFGFTYLPHRMNRRMLGSIVAIGLPLGLNSSIYSVGLFGEQQGHGNCQRGDHLVILGGHDVLRPEPGSGELRLFKERRDTDSAVFRSHYLHRRAGRDVLLPPASGTLYQGGGGSRHCGPVYSDCPAVHVGLCGL